MAACIESMTSENDDKNDNRGSLYLPKDRELRYNYKTIDGPGVRRVNSASVINSVESGKFCNKKFGKMLV